MNAAESLFESLDVLPFADETGQIAAELLANLSKKGRIIEQNDALIAATLLKHGCHRILTKNKKRFSCIPGLTVQTY